MPGKKSKCLLPLLLAFLCSFNAISQMSQTQIDSMLTDLRSAKEDSNKVKLLVHIADETGYTDERKALEYSKAAYDLSNTIHFERGQAKAAYQLGMLHMTLNDYPKSDSFLNIAEQKSIQLKDSLTLAKISTERGIRYFMGGNYWLAADYLSKAARQFDDLNDTTNAVITYQNLVAVLSETKEFGKAVEISRKLLNISEERKDTLEVGYSLQGLVTDLVNDHRMSEAQGYLTRLKTIGDHTRDQNLSSDIYNTLGMYYYALNDLRKAKANFEIAVHKAESLDNKFQISNAYNSLGQALCRLGNFNQAKEILLKGMNLAIQFEDKKAEADIAFSLSAIYDSTHDYKNAYQNLRRHAELFDSILNRETRNYTTALATQYETNKKENEILRLQKVQQQKDFEIRKRNTWLGIGAGLVFALLAIFYLFLKNYRTRQKLAKQRSALLEEKIRAVEKEQQVVSLQSMINGQETERTRIARDLHDGLGGVFSTVKMHYSILPQETPGIKENPAYKKTMELINNASDELRKVAHNMMPEVLMKVGLVEALRDFCSNISSGKLLKINFQAYGMEKRLGSATEIMLYRITQELVNNIIKHADATEAIIQINRDANRLSLTIEDNGKGFDTLEAEQKRSMGMGTVKSRVDYLNGKLTIDSRKDIGTTVMIDLLLNEN
jgi:two-component system, NarL family, sensor kinase